MLEGNHSEGALNGLVLAEVQRANELPDLLLTPVILLEPAHQISSLICEALVLVQCLLVHLPAKASSGDFLALQQWLIELLQIVLNGLNSAVSPCQSPATPR